MIKKFLKRVGRKLWRSAPGPLAPNDELVSLTKYLKDEVSDLRIEVRDLKNRLKNTSDDEDQTKDSFSYQWAEIKEGLALLGDPTFEKQMVSLMETYSDLPRGWFAGKKVLDAGCGMGRWSFVLHHLGADVTAVDQSASGIDNLNALLGESDRFRAIQTNLLEPVALAPDFDLVWCYGVTHHTGNTKLATKHVAECVKPGGRLFLMIYGEPNRKSEYDEINNYVKHRRATQDMSFEGKVDYLRQFYPEEMVHGYFDAISPRINDLHRFDEISHWLHDWGFENVHLTLNNRNLHLVADKTV